MNRGSKGLVAFLIVGLAAIHLLGVATSGIVIAIAAIAALYIAFRWVITGKGPNRNTIMLGVLLFIGPALLLALLQMGVITMRTWPLRQALLLLLALGVGLFWLGRKWRG